jgi:hypothetical protein
MKPLQRLKTSNIINPQTVGTDAVTGVFDTLGLDDVMVHIHVAAGAAGDPYTTMKVAHDDVQTGSYTDIPYAVGGGTSGGFTIPTRNTSTPSMVNIHVPRTGSVNRKRYLKVTLVGDATTSIACVKAISMPVIAPDSASEAGVDTVVYV